MRYFNFDNNSDSMGLRMQIFILLKLTAFSLIISICPDLYSQNGRGIDNERYMKKQKSKPYVLTREEDSLMQISNFWKRSDTIPEINQRIYLKEVKKYNKLVSGGGKDLVGGKKTYKRMRKSTKQAEYTRK